jgi:hypothetical protein
MRTWVACTVVAVMLFSPMTSVAAQTDGLADTERDVNEEIEPVNEYFDELEEYDKIQESEDHYVVSVPLPATVFREDTSQEVTVPVGSLDIQGEDGDGDYEVKIVVTPERVEAGEASLWQNAWAIEAQLENKAFEETLPALAEYQQRIDPTAESLWETLNNTHESAIELRRGLTEVAFNEDGDAESPDFPNSEDSAVLAQQAETLDNTIEDLEWTRNQAESVSDIWKPENLNTFERLYALASAIDEDLQELGGPETGELSDDARQQIRELEEYTIDLRNYAYYLYQYAWEQADAVEEWSREESNLPNVETCDWWQSKGCASEELYQQLEEISEDLADDPPADVGNLPETVPEDAGAVCDGTGEVGDGVCEMVVPCDQDEDQECQQPCEEENNDNNAENADNDGDECEEDPCEEDPDSEECEDEPPTKIVEIEYPPEAEDPVDEELDTLWKNTEWLREAEELDYETYAWFWDLAEFTKDYTKDIDNNLADSMELANETYHYWEESTRETVVNQLEAAQTDLQKVQSIAQDDDGGGDDGGGDDSSPAQDAQAHVENAMEAVEESLQRAKNAPGDFAEDQVDERTENPTHVRIYIPKDPSQYEPTSPTLEEAGETPPEDLDEETPDDVEDEREDAEDETPIDEDEVEDDLSPVENDNEDGSDDADEGDDTEDSDEDDSDADDGADGDETDSADESGDESGTEDGDTDGADSEDEAGDTDGEGESEEAEQSFDATLGTETVRMSTGEQDTMSLTVENTGDATDDYQLTTSADGPFTVDAGDAETVLEPGEQDTFQVRVSATDSGSGELDLHVSSGEGDVKTWTAAVEVAQADDSAAIQVDLDPDGLEIQEGGETFADVWVGNEDDESVRVELTPRTEGPVSAAPRGETVMELAPDEQKKATLELGGQGPGTGSVTVDVGTGEGDGLRPSMTVEVSEADGGADGDGSTEAAGEDGGEDAVEEMPQGPENPKGVPAPGLAAVLATLASIALAARRE